MNKKLIGRYSGRIKKFTEQATFFAQSYEKNLDEGRERVALELKHKVEKLESKIRIYKTVIEDLKQ
jgi:hypothetical protein